MTATAVSRPPTTIFGSSGYDFSCMKVGDFNADGKLDLVFAEFLVGEIGILFGGRQWRLLVAIDYRAQHSGGLHGV